MNTYPTIKYVWREWEDKYKLVSAYNVSSIDCKLISAADAVLASFVDLAKSSQYELSHTVYLTLIPGEGASICQYHDLIDLKIGRDHLKADGMNMIKGMLAHELAHNFNFSIYDVMLTEHRALCYWMWTLMPPICGGLFISAAVYWYLGDILALFCLIAGILYIWLYNVAHKTLHKRELDADATACYVLNAGDGLLEYMRKYELRTYYDGIPKYLVQLVKRGFLRAPFTHPTPEDRIKNINKTMKRIESPGLIKRVMYFLWSLKKRFRTSKNITETP